MSEPCGRPTEVAPPSCVQGPQKAPVLTPPRLAIPKTPTDEETAGFLRKVWAVRTFEEMKNRSDELGSNNPLVEGLIPQHTLGILVGDSGVGKSPLLYQLALCVAAGIPFLGHRVTKGSVLYLDYENGLGDSTLLVERLARHLNLDRPPLDFWLWHLADCAPSFGGNNYTGLDMIRAFRPTLAIVDSIGAYHPEIEEKNSIASRCYTEFRKIMRDIGTTILGVHHIRKPSMRADDAPASIEQGNLRSWFLQARGARSLINGTDVRLGVDLPSGRSGPPRRATGDTNEEISLVLRGFGRVRGEIGPFYVARSLDEEGEPLGYRRLMGVELLFNEGQEAAYSQLPAEFPFCEAKRLYGRADQATADFLGKCLRLGLLRKVGRGRYVKV